MDQNIKDKNLERLTKAETILVSVSQDSGFDGLAAGLAIYLSSVKLGKSSYILAPSPTVDDAKQLYGIGKIGKTNGKKNLVISVDNAVKKVEKVTYFLDGTKLKIVVHALPGSEGISGDELTIDHQKSQPDFIFAIGFNSGKDLEDKITHEHNINPEAWLVNIGKHKLDQKFVQVNFVNDEAASLCEIAAHLLQELALPMNEDIAYNLYSGISQATENFSPSRAKLSTFRAAEWLIKFGAGRASLAQDKEEQTQITDKRYDLEDWSQVSQDEVEIEKQAQGDWLKPPKIFKGSKSFDTEY